MVRTVALCYVRRSVVRTQADEISPQRQRANCVSEAEHRGWIAEIFEDAEGHRSGRHEQGRPGWLSLKAQIDRPEVAAVIVESLSRASRSVRDLHNFLADLEQHGIALVSLKERIDTSTAMGRAFVGFIAVLNQFESDIASERMMMNIGYKRESKGRHWGLTPFGCEREGPDRVLIPSREGSTVEGIWRGYHEALIKCYEWYADGETSIQQLADRLNASGYRFRDRHGEARSFTHWDVRRLLDANRLYRGYIPRGRAKDRPEEEFKGSHKPIVSLELCDRVTAVLALRHDRNASFRGRHGPGRVYLLSDLLYCATCGHRMAGMFQDRKLWYRHERAKRECPGKGQVLASTLEAQVLERLRQFQMPEQLKERIRFLARKFAEVEGRPDWQEAEASRRHLVRKLEILKDLRVEGEIDKMEYRRRKEGIEVHLREIQGRISQAPEGIRDIEDLLPQIDRIADVIRQGSPERTKRLFNTLFDRVEQRDGELTLLRPQAWARPFFNGGNGARVS
jgi:DNA invertase Pin-like site-specific DNA recombinase